MMIQTIGHSTKAIDEFIRTLEAHGVNHLVDIRAVPRSRHNPQFNRESLPASLKESGIEYAHLAGLGGLRRPRKDSQNTGWRNTSFRGYADYMQSQEFVQNLDQLIELLTHQRVAIMCAESVPWRCHRSLIADALAARGIPVLHIMSATSTKPHAITPFAVINGAQVTYPCPATEPRS